MGLQDRDYYRDDQPPGGMALRLPRTVTVWLILINVACYAANLLIGQDDLLLRWMTLQADALEQPWRLYELLTYGFAHAPLRERNGLLHIIFNMMVLFTVGRPVEQHYGRREFLAVYLAAMIFAGGVWAGLQLALGRPAGMVVGASGAVMAVTAVFCATFPQQRLAFFGVVPVPAWVAGIMIVGLDVAMAFWSGPNSKIAWEAHLAGAAFGLAYWRLGWRLTGWLGPAERRLRGLRRGRPQLRVHRADDAEPDAAPEPPPAPDPDDRWRRLDEEADALLAKVARDGEASLTGPERKKLEAWSRRIRERRR